MLAPNFEHHFRFLGKRIKDRITGFTGVGTSVCFDVYGCIQTCITAPYKDGAEKLGPSCWFDNNRIEVIEEDLVQPLPDFIIAEKAKDTPGGFDKPDR